MKSSEAEPIVIDNDSPSPEITNESPSISDTVQVTKKKKVDTKVPKRKRGRKKKKKDQFEETEDSIEGKKILSKLNKRYKKKNKGKSQISQGTNGHSGPYIEVKGPKDFPTACKVVNLFSTIGEYDGGDKKRKSKKIEGTADVTQPLSLVMDNSEPWECAFCHKSRHYKGLGDLFGPYHLEGMSSPPPSPGKSATKATLSSPTSRKRKNSEGGPVDEKSLKRQRLLTKKASRSPDHKGACHNPDLPKEIWVHEDCSVWASGVYCTGTELRGLQEAVVNALQAKCGVCKTYGASLGCFSKNCSKKYHYLCAVEQECLLDEHKFCMTCPSHNGK